jgi:hypothetical protein
MRNDIESRPSRRVPLGALLILASLPLAGCDSLRITEAPTIDAVTSLSAAPATAPADGATLVVITAEVDTVASPTTAEVKFATTLGTFAGAGGVAVTAPVAADGRARVQLKAPGDTGTAIVTATAGGRTRTLLVSFTPPVNGFTALTVSPPVVPADGASVTTVTAQVDLTAVPSVKQVVFTTTLGTFGGGATVTVPADATGTARAQLRAPADSGTAIVTATAGGVTRALLVAFDLAPPTRLELTAEKLALPAGIANTVKLTATPLRTVGSPSPGTFVTFSADTVGGHGGGFGRFSAPGVLLRAGAATSSFSAGETSYRGPVIVRAIATLAGQSVSDSTIVTVTNPPS